MCVDIKKNKRVKVEIEFSIQYGISWSQPQAFDSWRKKKRLANLNREKPKNIENKKVVKLKQYWDRFYRCVY